MTKQSKLILYHCDSSYASQKARLYLAEKDLVWQSHHIDLRQQEHITSNYRQINPQATVPALVDGKTIICGSTAIMLYLEEKHPEPVLLAQDQVLRQQQIDFAYSHERLHDPSLRLLSYIYIFMDKDKQKDMDVEKIITLSEQHPWRDRGDFLRKVLSNKVDKTEVKEARKQVFTALEHMEELLANMLGEYLIGRNYSIADSVATATLFRVEKLGFIQSIQSLTNP